MRLELHGSNRHPRQHCTSRPGSATASARAQGNETCNVTESISAMPDKGATHLDTSVPNADCLFSAPNASLTAQARPVIPHNTG